MKSIKYVLIILVLIFCTGITSEVYQNYLYVLSDEFCYVTFYMQPDTVKDDMLNDIAQCADKNNLAVFMIDRDSENNYKTVIDIYADSSAASVLEQEYMIEVGEYKSIFCGTSKINMYDFNMVSQEMLEKNHTFYLIGSMDDMRTFKSELVEQYAGSFPEEGGRVNLSYMKRMLCVVWCAALFLIVFMTFYEVLFREREYVIRVTMGEEIINLVFENSLLDAFVIVLFYVVFRCFFEYITGVSLFAWENALAVTIIIVLNSFMYTRLFRVDFKKAFAHGKMSDRVVTFNYFIKAVITVCVALILATNCMVIYEAVSYYRQKDFYKEYADYSYIQFGTWNDNNVSGQVIDEVQSAFYTTYFTKSNIMCLTNDMHIDGCNVAVANYNAWDYLVSKLPELKTVEHDNCCLLIVPNDYSLSEDDEYYLMAGYADYRIITYKRSVNLVVQDCSSEQKSFMFSSPVIVYDGMKNFTGSDDEYELPYSFDKFLVNASREDIEAYLSDKGIDIGFAMTNVYDSFLYNWRTLKRAMILNIVLSVIFVVLEILVDATMSGGKLREAPTAF